MPEIELAYVQKDDRGEFMSDAVYTFWRGCQQLGIETVSFVQSEIDSIQLRRDTVVHGGVGMVRRAFERLGVDQPRLDGLPPKGLEAFYGRRMWATTMAEVRQRYETNEHIFIKPLNRQKAFSGHVTSGNVGDLVLTAGLDNNFEIMASEIIGFATEYRLMVHNATIVACRHYRGDFRIPLFFAVADAVVKAFKQAPVAYSLDMGVTPEGKTVVVEINDAFSLGSYGTGTNIYTKMVLDRWEEIVGLNQVRS